MKYTNHIFGIVAMAVAAACMSSCSNSTSYAELLSDESHAINRFLSQQVVILDVPSDSVFIEGEDAPYYRLDEDGNVYLQIVDSGNKNQMAKSDETIYFRFTRYSLYDYDMETNTLPEGWGNASDLSVGSASFRYGNYTLSSSSSWGSGLQAPLSYVGMDATVNVIIRSQYGLSDEIASVIPYLYHVTYYKKGTSGYNED
jgi:hypothetical protein